MKESTICFNPV